MERGAKLPRVRQVQVTRIMRPMGGPLLHSMCHRLHPRQERCPCFPHPISPPHLGPPICLRPLEVWALPLPSACHHRASLACPQDCTPRTTWPRQPWQQPCLALASDPQTPCRGPRPTRCTPTCPPSRPGSLFPTDSCPHRDSQECPHISPCPRGTLDRCWMTGACSPPT